MTHSAFLLITSSMDKLKIVTQFSHSIAGAHSTNNSFSLAYDTTAATCEVFMRQNIYFIFTIYKDLWKYDMRDIHMSSKFVVESDITCDIVETSKSHLYKTLEIMPTLLQEINLSIMQ